MKKEILVSLLAIVTIVVSIWGYNFITGKNLFSKDKVFYGVYRDVRDVDTATPVYIHGYQVGTVISIEPIDEDVSKIKLGFKVKNEIRLPDYTVAILRSSNPLGGKEITLDFDKMCDGTNCAEPGQILKSEELGIVSSMLPASELKPVTSTIAGTIQETLESLGDKDSDAAVHRSFQSLASALESLSASASTMEQIMNKSSRHIEKTVANMSSVSANLVTYNDNITGILENLEVISAELKEASLSNTISNANNTLASAQSAIQNMEGVLTETKNAVNELQNVVSKINDGDGTMSRLLNEQELYDNLELTSKNLSLLLQDLRLNPKRYINVSVFGKKQKDYAVPESDPAFDRENDKN